MLGLPIVPSIAGLPCGVGLGWRYELSAALLAAPQTVDFIEVIAETCFQNAPLYREALALSELWKGRVLPHGIKLSLGSADGIDKERARRLGALARDLRAPLISEHVAFTGHRGHGRRPGQEIGHLTQLPLCRTAVAVVARNLVKARRHLPDVPFLLETPAWTLRWPEDEMSEGDFFGEIAQATGCDLLLDVGNIYANALNSGCDPLTLLRSYPLSRVGFLHVAGGAWRDGFYVDTHAHATPDAVFTLLAEVLRHAGPVPILIERDANFPAFSALAEELDRARQLLDSAGPKALSAAGLSTSATAPAGALSIAELAARQAHLATLLTAAEPPLKTTPFDATAVRHSRSILWHKRQDEMRARSQKGGAVAPSGFGPSPSPDAARPSRFAWAQRLLRFGQKRVHT